jgi:hypothetical protein
VFGLCVGELGLAGQTAALDVIGASCFLLCLFGLDNDNVGSTFKVLSRLSLYSSLNVNMINDARMIDR